MLGGDAPAVALHQLEHRVVGLARPLQELRFVQVVGLHDVDVEVAVTDVPEEADLPAGVASREQLVELRAEVGERRDGQRDVVLVRQAGRREALADPLAQRPQRSALRAVLRHGAVRDELALEERREPAVERRAVGRLDLEQHVVRRVAAEGRPELPVALHAGQALVGEELVGHHREGAVLAHVAEEAQHRGEVGHSEQEDVELAGQARELERRLGDDAERALAADEELPQVEAGVVLLERAVELQDVSRRGDDLQAEHPLPRQPVADDLHATRVGGDVPAHLAGPLGREVHGPRQPVGRDVLVHGLRDRARLHAHGLPEDVHEVHAPPLCERQHDLARGGHRAAGEAGPSSGRDHRDARVRAEAQDPRNLLGRAGPHDGGRGGGVNLRPVLSVLRQVRRLDPDEVLRCPLAELFEKSLGESTRRGSRVTHEALIGRVAGRG